MSALMATVRKQIQAAVANLMKATKNKAQVGKVQRALNKNFGSTILASNLSNSVNAAGDEALLNGAALTRLKGGQLAPLQSR